MDLVNVAKIAWRRWYAVLVGVVLTAAGAGLVLTLPPTYEATSVLVLLAPNTPAPGAIPTGEDAPDDPTVNPYQAFDGSITVTAELMSTEMTQPRVVADLVARGASPDYQVTTDPDTGGPTVTITTRAGSAAEALKSTRLVTSEFHRQLEARQLTAGAPTGSLITASEVVDAVQADQLVSGRIRALVAVLAVGTVASIVLALAVDAIANARRRRRDRSDPPGSPATPGGDPDPVPVGVAEFGTRV